MADQELISAIITTCRRDAGMVGRAVSSVLNQTHRRIELIVVDDSPADFPGRDEVGAIVASFDDPRARYLRHAVNQGACAARNTGLAHAVGQYVAFLDDDDEWLPEKLEKQLAKFREAGDACGLVGCGSIYVNEAAGTRRVRKARFVRGMVFDQLILENFIGSTSYPLIRRACIDACGGFDPLMKSAQDYELWLRIAKKYPIDFVDEPLVVYHMGAGPRISTNAQNRVQGLERLNEIHRDYLKAHPAARRERMIKLIPHYVPAGKKLKAWRVFLAAALMNPFALKGNYLALRQLLKG